MKDWKKVKLGSLLTESKIESANPSADNRISVKLNVKGVEKRPMTKDKEGATKYYTRKAGQFIYGKQNLHKGAFGIIPEELDGHESSSDIPAFDVDECCYPEWIYYFFKKGNFYLKLEGLAKGVGSKRIQPHQIYELDIYLPEKDEQKEILDQIALLETNHGQLLNEIDKQENLLTQLRHSILQDAIQGKLTAEWRKQNPEIEPACELLKRIKVKKEQLIKEKKIKKENPLPSIKAEEIPFEIPKSWEWCRMQDLCPNISSGSTPPKNEFTNEGIPYLKVYNIQNQKIEFDYKPQFVNEECHNGRLKRSILRPGDVIFNIVGPPLGKTAIIPSDYEEWNCNQAIAFFKPVIIELNAWIYTFFLSEDYLKRIELIGTAGQDNISVTKSKNIEIPLPPLKEQVIICKKVELLLIQIQALEKEIEDCKKYAALLLQSILAELLGKEITLTTTPKKEINKIAPEREIKYDSKTTLMELVALLKKHGRLHAEDLWKMSKFPEDIDKFYAELKVQIEQEKTIKESAEKGYLELT